MRQLEELWFDAEASLVSFAVTFTYNFGVGVVVISWTYTPISVHKIKTSVTYSICKMYHYKLRNHISHISPTKKQLPYVQTHAPRFYAAIYIALYTCCAVSAEKHSVARTTNDG